MRQFVAATLVASLSWAAQQKVSGQLTGFQGLRDNDDFADAALVLPSLRSEAVVSFDFRNLLAPNEPMRAGPQTVQVPGNLVVPTQRERYVISVTLEKLGFSLQMTPGQTEELGALHLRAPFNALISKARAQAPWYEMAALPRWRAYAFASERDWTRETSPTLTLSASPTVSGTWAWTRAARASNEVDVRAVLQRTPAQRWFPVDVEVNPGTSGNFSGYAQLGNEFKVIVGRIRNDAQKQPVAGRAWIVSAERAADLSFSELPPHLEGVKVSADHRVQWTPLHEPGWLAIFTQRAKMPQFLGSWWFKGIDFDSQVAHGWVNPSLGEFQLPVESQAYQTTLLFVGTQQAVPLPTSDNAELFLRMAREVRMQKTP